MSQNLPNDPFIELILVNTARKYAPALVPTDWKKSGDLQKPLYTLARELANYHILVILGERDNTAPQNNPVAVRETGEIYTRFYHLLADNLFSSLPKRIDASYYSYSRTTLMIKFDAEARGVIEVMAGYIAPYVVERQKARAVTTTELQDLMSRILQKLDAGDESQPEYRRLRDEGAEIIRQMLAMRLRQIPLTRFDEPFFGAVQPPASLPEEEETQRARPFVDQSSPHPSDDEPDFIKAMREPRQKPPTLPEKSPAPPDLPQLENQEPTSETGKDARVNDQGERTWPPAPPTLNPDNTIRPPIPYWRDDDKKDGKK